MIRGFYNADGQAVINGLLSFRMGRSGRPMSLAISFVVDTGADDTLLFPANYEPFVYSDFAKFPTDWPGGIGGNLEVRLVPAYLRLRHHTGAYERLSLTVEVAKPAKKPQALPSLLGRDVLNRYSLTADPSVNLVTLSSPLGPTP